MPATWSRGGFFRLLIRRYGGIIKKIGVLTIQETRNECFKKQAKLWHYAF